MALEPGQSIGRYEIESTLGKGAMGTVYRAKDRVLRREVALKVLEPAEGDVAGDHDATAGGIDPEAKARFVREARAAAAVHHPNIAAVYDVGEHEGLPFIAMELIVGSTLRSMIGHDDISVAMRIRWLVEIARALAEAHERGLVHRDVKPENVLVSTEGVVKLVDFGIVKRRARESQPGPMSFRTRTGQLVGTPEYMAPEQWTSSDVDGRADQYAWGLIAYELLTGKPLPLGRPHPIDTIVPSLPEDVVRCVTRATEHRREERYASMTDVVRVLDPYASSTVSEVALRHSQPPTLPLGKPNHTTEGMKSTLEIGVAETLDMRAGHPPTTLPLATPRVRITPPDEPRPLPRSERRPRSATRTFLLAVAITLLVAGVVVAILIALLPR